MYMYMYITGQHCSFYVLIMYHFDPVFCYLFVGAKELNLAATVEHLRDHRPRMVRTKVLEHVYTIRSKLTLYNYSY